MAPKLIEGCELSICGQKGLLEWHSMAGWLQPPRKGKAWAAKTVGMAAVCTQQVQNSLISHLLPTSMPKRWVAKGYCGSVAPEVCITVQLERRELMELPLELLCYMRGQKEQNEIALSLSSSCGNSSVFCGRGDKSWCLWKMGEQIAGWFVF